MAGSGWGMRTRGGSVTCAAVRSARPTRRTSNQGYQSATNFSTSPSTSVASRPLQRARPFALRAVETEEQIDETFKPNELGLKDIISLWITQILQTYGDEQSKDGAPVCEGKELSHPTRSASAIAHTRTRRDYYDQKGLFPIPHTTEYSIPFPIPHTNPSYTWSERLTLSAFIVPGVRRVWDLFIQRVLLHVSHATRAYDQRACFFLRLGWRPRDGVAVERVVGDSG